MPKLIERKDATKNKSGNEMTDTHLPPLAGTKKAGPGRPKKAVAAPAAAVALKTAAVALKAAAAAAAAPDAAEAVRAEAPALAAVAHHASLLGGCTCVGSCQAQRAALPPTRLAPARLPPARLWRASGASGAPAAPKTGGNR